jgi:para-aminobenzoate synthetase component 1
MSSTRRIKNGLATRTAAELDHGRPNGRAQERCEEQVSLPLVEEISPDIDPVEAFEHLASLPHLLFFDSAGHRPLLGRYSFLTADPFEWIWSRGRRIFINGEVEQRETGGPFSVLAEHLQRWRTAPVAGLPPFQGGAAGVFGYDLCHHLERLPRPRIDDFEIPDLAVGFYDWVLAFDHREERAWIISTGFPETDPGSRRRRALTRLAEVRRRLAERKRPLSHPGNENRCPVAAQYGLPLLDGLTSNFRSGDYLETVGRAIEYIHAGDCFQVNIAQRLLYSQQEHPVQVYRRLRECNPAPFAGYLDMGDFVLASASPERFLRVAKGEVEARPIKGTRPRGASPPEDRMLTEELLASAKDRAENIMIVDLLRNDLGRVCQYGSIRVPALCRLETYQYVHHLVSEVRGRLREVLGPIDLLRAAFPGGSVTGAPKIRAMEIIAELEPTARGPYCGSLAYLGFDGSMDSSILIRTFTIGRGWVQFPVGGGIVADSDPQREYDETLHKAEGMIRALE